LEAYSSNFIQKDIYLIKKATEIQNPKKTKKIAKSSNFSQVNIYMKTRKKNFVKKFYIEPGPNKYQIPTPAPNPFPFPFFFFFFF